MQRTLDPSYAAAADVLRNARRVVITTHMNPDGDAVGSVCALRHFLAERGVAVRIVLPTPAPANLLWIPGATDMEVCDPALHASVIHEADTLVILDVNARKRIEPVASLMLAASGTRVCIDHHIQPEDLAHVQCTDVDAAATCSMLADVLRAVDPTQPFSPAVAMALYVGIMTDTGSFRFPRTTGDLHRKIAGLLDAGADPVRAYDEVFNRSTVERLNMLGEALCSVRTFHEGQLCVMVITAADLRRHQCTTDDVEGFVHHTLSIEGVTMGVMIVELDTEIKLSFRSKGTTYVRDLAASFGGGGHVYAAGARVKERPLDAVVEAVIAAAGTAIGRS